MKILLLSLLSVAMPAYAADLHKSNLEIVDDFAIPAYQALQKSSGELVNASNNFCSKAGDVSFNGLKASYHKTMDAWQSAQILRSGPAGKNMRSFRLEMWPDRSNAAAKHLQKLQKEANPESLAPKKFSKSSTAVQGLSAMERVIYAKDSKAEDFQTDGKANFKCQLVQAISLNVQSISNDLLTAWQKDYYEVIAKPSKDNDFFETDKEATAQFLNDLNTQLQVVIEQKIDRPMDGDNFRLTRAESWRSQRSLRNISLNLVAAKKMYQIGFAPHVADDGLKQKQQALFDTAIVLGKDLDVSLQMAHDEKAEPLKKWIESIKTLKASINTELPKAVDIPLGFNSLDGD